MNRGFAKLLYVDPATSDDRETQRDSICAMDAENEYAHHTRRGNFGSHQNQHCGALQLHISVLSLTADFRGMQGMNGEVEELEEGRLRVNCVDVSKDEKW